MVELNDIYQIALIVIAGRLAWDLYGQGKAFIIFYLNKSVNDYE